MKRSYAPTMELLKLKSATLPFIPNLDRRPYLLIMIKRTTRRTQAKAASPTAMETYKEPNTDSQEQGPEASEPQK